jgi:hypothetical protein
MSGSPPTDRPSSETEEDTTYAIAVMTGQEQEEICWLLMSTWNRGACFRPL